MKSRFFILLVTAVALLSSCSAYRDASGIYQSASDYYTQQYYGVPRADIVASLGAPARETSDGKGGTIMVYERYYSYSTRDVWGYPYRDVDMHYRQFFMDREDKCYRVMTNESSPAQAGVVATAFGISGAITAGACLIPALIFALTPRNYGSFSF